MNVKRASSSFSVVAILFISIIAIMFAIYGSSGKQYETIQGATTVTSLTNANIASVGNSQQVTTALNNVNATQQPIVGSCTSTNLLGNLYCALINTGNVIKGGFQTAYCDALGALGLDSTSNCLLATNIGNSLSGSTNIQQGVGNVVGASVSNTGVSNNALVKFASTPFGQAMIALGTFLALGVLAGLLGAGILARVMVLAGLALSIIVYIEGQLASFSGTGGLPDYIWWLVNGIFTAIMIIIVWEAFDSGGVG